MIRYFFYDVGFFQQRNSVSVGSFYKMEHHKPTIIFQSIVLSTLLIIFEVKCYLTPNDLYSDLPSYKVGSNWYIGQCIWAILIIASWIRDYNNLQTDFHCLRWNSKKFEKQKLFAHWKFGNSWKKKYLSAGF